LAAFEQACTGQSPCRVAPARQAFIQFLRTQCAIGQQRQQGLAAAAPAAGIVSAAAGHAERPVFIAERRQRLRFAQRQWQRIRIRLARRTEPVIGGPGQRLHQLGVEQGGIVEQSQHLFQPGAADRRLDIDRHHDANLLAAAERHQHPAAHRRLARRGRQVVEQGRQGERKSDAKDGRHGYLVAAQCNCSTFAASR
jgi:hypothetical protein